jgi:hypothetical protein
VADNAQFANRQFVHLDRAKAAAKDDLKPGVPFRIQTAAKQPDGSYTAANISVGKDGGRPF